MTREHEEMVTVVGEPLWWDLKKPIERKEHGEHRKKRNPFIAKNLPTALFLIANALCILIVWNVATNRATRIAEQKSHAWYEAELQAYKDEQEALRIAALQAPDVLMVERESKAIAKVLYGVRNNSTDDLKTCVWCILNRVDSTMYPDTVEEVIAQPKQWMGYREDNPVLEDLYQLAHETLVQWYNGDRRPVSADYVYLNWTPSEIVLRDNWEDGSRTHYWRYK